jgi:anti-anti-sigma factor
MAVTIAPHAPVVRPGARVDVTTVAELRRELHAALDDAGPEGVLVDLRDVTVMDAAGLGMLVAAQRRASLAGTRVVLTEVPASVARVLAATRLHRVFRLDRTALFGGAAATAR